MAFIRLNRQISRHRTSYPKILSKLVKINKNYSQDILNFNKRYLWLWNRKKANQQCAPPNPSVENVICASPCRKRVPQCPEHIQTPNVTSKCLEKGYGEPIKGKLSWLRFIYSPTVIKPKPSNCPIECPKELTFLEYIFGPDPPLPDPTTCRRAYKIKQECNEEDPRLNDPRYEMTAGDVLIFSEAPKFETCSTPEPKPASGPKFVPPNSVICKKVADSVAGLDCYCACVPLEKESCPPNLCPVHKKPFKFPYEEMRPRNPKKQHFTCNHGIATEDVTPPPRSEACTCVNPTFLRKSKFPPAPEVCDFHEALQRRRQAMKKINLDDECADKKLSRNERLKLITARKEQEMNTPIFVRNVAVASCERCNTDRAIPKRNIINH